jgi:hypothetical protein
MWEISTELGSWVLEREDIGRAEVGRVFEVL